MTTAAGLVRSRKHSPEAAGSALWGWKSHGPALSHLRQPLSSCCPRTWVLGEGWTEGTPPRCARHTPIAATRSSDEPV